MSAANTDDRKSQTRRYRTVLTIAGSDSGGGAGIQADLKTTSALGCFGMTAITALTAQNTLGVHGIHAVPPAFIENQIEAVFSDMGADAVKIGMLFSPELIVAVARQLQKHAARNIVLDPVMVAQSGDKLLQDDAVDALTAHLFPLADVVTPNLPEASVLLNRDIDGEDQIASAARDIARFGSRSVLVKGGHLEFGESIDVLFLSEPQRCLSLTGKRIATANNHGTGCTLSSAIASFLAQGKDLEEAVRSAKTYIGDAISAGAHYRLGKGSGPVHHFYNIWL
ncbi:Hydroxymethylpyrimidine phosphate kinase ThiD (EC [Olavius algarvensis associated proteobacterium Delta 3]|nr:Hydroxymethylpyrimidine phosphate kinase ThiD (EC [Olavius algarvensis associated proteobacterium Delta 3]CAB5149569.1 Hydroxymethylpyrimidine phosphate kinase ThiD (EC [Olavius algarvensis associated proteobacterium Delta 3]